MVSGSLSEKAPARGGRAQVSKGNRKLKAEGTWRCRAKGRLGTGEFHPGVSPQQLTGPMCLGGPWEAFSSTARKEF